MKKRILSMTLILSIVASLFAVANFGAIAKDKLVAGTDYTLSGYNNKSNFNLDPKENLLNNVVADNVYWFNVDERDTSANGGATYTDKATLVTKPGWADNLGLATVETNTPSASQPAFQITNSLGLELFIDFDDKGNDDTTDDTPIFDTPNESMQWAQTNYTLPERSEITDITLTRYEASENVGLYAPTAYQYIFSDTEAGLITGIGATVVEVNHTAATIKNVTTVTLSKPVTAKYMAIRMLQPYNIYATEGQKNTLKGKATAQKFYQWNRLDVHGTPAEELGYTISGYNNQSNFNLDPNDNLLKNVPADNLYWYNVDPVDVGDPTYTDTAKLITDKGWYDHLDFATREQNAPGATDNMAFQICGHLSYKMFFKHDGNNLITSMDTPSDMQWVQTNYTLPEPSIITDVTLARYEASDNVSLYAPTTYQYIFSNTQAGLVTGEGATVVTVDHTKDTIKNVTTVTLTKPVAAKYMALRMYQPYNVTGNATSSIIGKGIANKWYNWNRLDVHGETLPYTVSGVNNRNDSPVDITKNLLSDIVPDDFYWLNTDANDSEEAIATTPTKIPDKWIAKEHIAKGTSSENTIAANQPAFWLTANQVLMRELFIQMTGTSATDAKILSVDEPDVNKQWVQANYTLPAEAKISDVILSFNGMTNDTLNGRAPRSYQYIFADTKEGLISGEGATVITIDHTAETIKNISKVSMKDGKEITAKYFAVRLLQPYNDFTTVAGTNGKPQNWSGAAVWSNFWYTFSRIDVNGTYTNAVTEDITAKAVDADGADVAISATATATAIGGIDNNGKYGAKKVALAAESTKTIGDYIYTFAGWYKNGNEVLATAEGEVTVTDTDAVAFTAKYTKEKAIVYYTVTFVDYDGTELKSETVENGAAATAPVDPARVGYTFTGWDVAFDNVTSNLTVTAQYAINKYTVTFMADGETVDTQTINWGEDAVAPADPEKEGYTFTGWDADFSNVTDNLTVNAVYEINKYTVTFVFDGEEVGTEEVEHGKTANVPAVAGKEGYNVVWNYNDAAIVEDTTITGGYQIKTFTVNFYVEGELKDTQYIDWNTAAKAPEVDAKYGYDFAWDVDFANVTEDLEVNGAYTEKADNCTITFESITGKVLGTVIVENGDVPADVDAVKAEIDAITASVEKVYGYTFNGWDSDVYGDEITSSFSVRPQYVADETVRTNVYVEDVDGTELINEEARYDAAIYLASKQGAQSWTDAKEGGNVLIAAPTGTLYACGSAMEIYAKAEALEADDVAFVGKNHEEGKGFSVFAHVNVEGATKYGFIFASSKYFNEENKDFKIEDLTPNRVTNVEVETGNVEGKVDFMTTLHYSDSLPNPTRYARAYVVVNGQYIYSDVICNK